eukprot:scaffold20742_cov125-Isochrysis_galbana.AAC.1
MQQPTVRPPSAAATPHHASPIVRLESLASTLLQPRSRLNQMPGEARIGLDALEARGGRLVRRPLHTQLAHEAAHAARHDYRRSRTHLRAVCERGAAWPAGLGGPPHAPRRD